MNPRNSWKMEDNSTLGRSGDKAPLRVWEFSCRGGRVSNCHYRGILLKVFSEQNLPSPSMRPVKHAIKHKTRAPKQVEISAKLHDSFMFGPQCVSLAEEMPTRCSFAIIAQGLFNFAAGTLSHPRSHGYSESWKEKGFPDIWDMEW